MKTFILEEGRTTPCCPFCRRYEHAGHAGDCPLCFAEANRREHDLVRQMRVELLADKLITESEYAALATEFGGVQRLENYDALRESRDRLYRQIEQGAYNSIAADCLARALRAEEEVDRLKREIARLEEPVKV